MQGIIGGVEIKNDLLRYPGVGVEKHVDEDVLERLRIMADLMVAVAAIPRRMLQPIHRALARQRCAVLAFRLEPVREQGQHRIKA